MAFSYNNLPNFWQTVKIKRKPLYYKVTTIRKEIFVKYSYWNIDLFWIPGPLLRARQHTHKETSKVSIQFCHFHHIISWKWHLCSNQSENSSQAGGMMSSLFTPWNIQPPYRTGKYTCHRSEVRSALCSHPVTSMFHIELANTLVEFDWCLNIKYSGKTIPFTWYTSIHHYHHALVLMMACRQTIQVINS